MQHFRVILHRAVHALGYEVRRPADDRALYRELYAPEVLAERRFYNVGAGAFRHPYWTNVDRPSDWYASAQRGNLHLAWDLLDGAPLPVADGSAEVVYSSHVIEHVPDAAARHLFEQAHRSLRAGGTLRITAPNIELAVRAYRDGDRSYFYWRDWYGQPHQFTSRGLLRPLRDASLPQLLLWHFAAAASTLHRDGAPQPVDDDELARLLATRPLSEALDACTARCPPDVQRRHPGTHCNWWTPDKVVRFVREAGFERVHVSAYGQSFCPVLRNTALFDCTHPKVSLYVEAVR